MDTPALHLVIATDQNLANLIPALQCKAHEVWVLQTPEMKRKGAAAHLADALKARGVRVERIDFADDDVSTLHAQAEAVARRVGGRAVAINLTGGTKLMTLALVQTLLADLQTEPGAQAPHLVYCDTRHRRLDWLAPSARSEPMQTVLRIDDILLAQGYRRQAGSGGAEAAEWQRQAQDRQTLTRFMGDEARSLGRFYGALNALARNALGEGGKGCAWRPEQLLPFSPGGRPAELLRRARDQGLLHWPDEADMVVFQDTDAARYLGGGWVEELAGMKISGCRPDDWAPRARIQHVDSRATNELDALVVHRNRLLLVECKAARPDGGAMADYIYKAGQLARQVGGTFAHALILSAREPKPEHLQRASEYGVTVLAGAELSQFPAWLREWMRG